MTSFFDKIFCWFYVKVVAPSKLPTRSSQSQELHKLALARIAVGVIMLIRTALSLYAAYYYYEPYTLFGVVANYHFVFSAVILVVVLAFTLGLFTPIATSLLLLFYSDWDVYMVTTTLGTMILVYMLILLLVTNSGRYYSIDSKLFKSNNKIVRTSIRVLYKICGIPGVKQISTYYFLTFAAYAVTSFGALTFHVQDEYWRSGATVGSLMTSSFLSSNYDLARHAQHAFPGLFSAFSKMAVLGQTFYQLFMLLLVYSRLGYLFVLIWGSMFILISWFSLQLSYLAPLEVVMWLTAMYPTPRFISSAKANATDFKSATKNPNQYRAFTGAIVLGFAALCIPFTFQFSLIREKFPNIQLPQAITRCLYKVGFWCPDVFNKTDLAMSNNWCVIYRCYKDGRKELVPFNNVDGSRGFYYLMDPLYFGNGLVYRRRFQDLDFKTDELLTPAGMGYQYVDKVLHFDKNRLGSRAPDFYRVEILSKDEKLTHDKSLEEDNLRPAKLLFQYDRTI